MIIQIYILLLFTGFDEFEYAKEAVHLEIEEYMLKPVNAVELSDCMDKTERDFGPGERRKIKC